jgi:hypothetical protein
VVFQAGYSATKANFNKKPDTTFLKLKYWGLITLLHMIQPIARLYGRIKHGLTPWRKRGYDWADIKSLFFSNNTQMYWSETWKSNEEWLTLIERNLTNVGNRVKRSGSFDAWDLQVNSGLFSSARGILTVEEHGGGKQYVKFKSWIKFSIIGLCFIALLAFISILALLDKAFPVVLILGSFTGIVIYKYFVDTIRAITSIKNAFSELSKPAIENLNEVPEVYQKEENGNAVYHPAFKWKKAILPLPDSFFIN